MAKIRNKNRKNKEQEKSAKYVWDPIFSSYKRRITRTKYKSTTVHEGNFLGNK